MTPMTETLSPGVPAQIANLYETHEIEWVPGWGDYKTKTGLHGALLRPCAEPGDEIMWSILLSYRGLTISWNDDQPSVDPIIVSLREQPDPDEAEMLKVFGPNWEAARWVCRTWVTASDEQKRDARAAWAAWAAWAARAAWDAWDAWAARAAWDARDARAAWAAWAARDARAARAAWAAFLATISLPWVGTVDDWTAEAHARAVAPFESVFGKIPNAT